MSCACTGMNWIGKAWVFTGECEHTRAASVKKAMELRKRLFEGDQK